MLLVSEKSAWLPAVGSPPDWVETGQRGDIRFFFISLFYLREDEDMRRSRDWWAGLAARALEYYPMAHHANFGFVPAHHATCIRKPLLNCKAHCTQYSDGKNSSRAWPMGYTLFLSPFLSAGFIVLITRGGAIAIGRCTDGFSQNQWTNTVLHSSMDTGGSCSWLRPLLITASSSIQIVE